MPAKPRKHRRSAPLPPSKGSRLLFAFLEKYRITYGVAAAALRVSRVTAYQWATGSKRPTADRRIAIERWTSGAVPAASWKRRGEDLPRVRPFAKTGTEG